MLKKLYASLPKQPAKETHIKSVNFSSLSTKYKNMKLSLHNISQTYSSSSEAGMLTYYSTGCLEKEWWAVKRWLFFLSFWRMFMLSLPTPRVRAWGQFWAQVQGDLHVSVTQAGSSHNQLFILLQLKWHKYACLSLMFAGCYSGNNGAKTKPPKPNRAESFAGKGVHDPVSPMEYPSESSSNIYLVSCLLLCPIQRKNTWSKLKVPGCHEGVSRALSSPWTPIMSGTDEGNF